jgi:arginine:agmatine antiporter
VPAAAIVISALLATALVLVQATGRSGFAAIYALIIGLATLTAVIPYAFCALAAVLIEAREHGPRAAAARVSMVEIVAFIFSLFVVYGCGAEAVLYGLLLLLLGIPVYVWQRREQLAVSAAATGVAEPVRKAV